MGGNLYILVQNDIEKSNYLENQMFADFNEMPAFYCLQENSNDKITALFARRKLQKVLSTPINIWLKDRYVLGKYLKENVSKYSHIYVLFINTAFTTVRYPAKVLKLYQRKWPQVKYILYYTDSVCRGVSSYANYLREEGVFDAVYSFDSLDSKERNMIYWKTPYSVNKGYQEIPISSDLYFVGVGTDRFHILCEVAEHAETAGIKSHMDIIHTLHSDDVPKNISVHSFDDVIPYQESLKKTMEARCILDVLRPNQTGLSLRAYEAVVYKRKLLTNNPSILTFPFYDPRYMRYFGTVEDIDWDWVKEEIPVDYHYNGEFSPIRLLQDIENRLFGSDDGTGSVSQ